MTKKLDKWQAWYNRGLMNPVVVEASTEKEAKNAALIEFRRNRTDVNFWDADFVVKAVKRI